ncbi:MAG TPA: hypothetical protein VGP82_06145 [Ktedonobacterales bacterium]|nr:hypothetical protein [Ktedonobacterales bacterium]
MQRLLDGETDARALAELARPEAACQAGRARPSSGWSAGGPPCVPGTREQLAQLEYLDAASARVDAELEARVAAEHEAVALLETIPGVGQRTAQVLVASPRSAPTCRVSPAPRTWPPGPGCARATPRVAADAESGRTRRGNPWLRRTLAEVANVASRMKGTYLAAQFRRSAARRGKGRAVIAVGHAVLVAIYDMLTRRKPYHELGAQYFDEHQRGHVERRLVRRLERLGFAVTLEALPATS